MYKHFFKRSFDLIISVIVFPIFILVLMVVGPIIYFQDKGPIFYNSPRLGKDGLIFKMCKFRSMKVNAPDLRNEDGSTFNAEDDHRLTSIGKFIRKTSIDEIPQIINVIIGNMSIIGPRPDLPEHRELYIGNESRKLEVRPGITGYNQAYFRNTVPWKDRIKNDIYYIDHLSLHLDIKIFFRTIVMVLKRKDVFISTSINEEMLNVEKISLQGTNFDCVPLTWDTDYFGVKSARVNLSGVISENDQILIKKFSENYEFVTIFNKNNMRENNNWVGTKTNAFLVDLNIQFSKNIEFCTNQPDENTYVLNRIAPEEQIIKIARDAFQHSRFFNDTRLPKIKAANIYLHWTECAFGLDNKYFAICKRDNQIAGFILFSITEDVRTGVIELIAVDEKFRGQSVGKSLIQRMELFCFEKSIININVGTQVDNISAIQFYNATGFRYVGCNSVYHLWSSSINNPMILGEGLL